MTNKQAKAIIKQVLANDGGTYRPDGEVYTSLVGGYQVATVKVVEMLPIANLTVKLIKEVFEMASLRELMFNMMYELRPQVGFWVHKGWVYIDLTKTIIDKEYALELGRRFNQDSIWDWNAMESVKV